MPGTLSPIQLRIGNRSISGEARQLQQGGLPPITKKYWYPKA